MLTYYFDASDGGPTDPNGVWNNEANGFDGSTATQTATNFAGSTSSNYIMAEGTNAPTSGSYIYQVRARGHHISSAATVRATVYTDGLAEDLGELTIPIGTPGYGPYIVLTAPVGGWTWQAVNDLEVKAYRTAGTAASFTIIEIEVTCEAASSPSSSISASPSNSPSSSESASPSPSPSSSLSASPSSSPSASQSPSSSPSSSLSSSVSTSPSSSPSASPSPGPGHTTVLTTRRPPNTPLGSRRPDTTELRADRPASVLQSNPTEHTPLRSRNAPPTQL